MIPRLPRQPRDRPDRFLDWKVRIFFAGAVLLLLAIVLDRPPLALLAAAVLAVGILLRGIERFSHRDDGAEE